MTDGQRQRTAAAFTGLLLLLLLLALMNLMCGSVPISVSEVLNALTAGERDSMAVGIVRSIRLPRLLAAALLGGALSVSGFLLQTFFGNPIAGPFVLGISSGAKLTVALGMIVCLSRNILMNSAMMILAAFLGAMLTMALVLLASVRLQGMGMLLVCGVMIGYICSAVTEIAVAFADDSNIVNLHNWSQGSFSGIGWDDLSAAACVVLLTTGMTWLLSKPMDAYRLGESYARSMGVRIRPFRAALILLSGLLSASVTAFAGPISFVGIAVPQLMKALFKTAKPALMIPACFLGGGTFCLLCDLLARVIFAPTELSVSSVTAVFGAPVVIRVLLTHRRRGAEP